MRNSHAKRPCPISRLFPAENSAEPPSHPKVMKTTKTWTHKNLQAESGLRKSTLTNRSRVKKENSESERNRNTFCGLTFFARVQMLTVFATSCYFAPQAVRNSVESQIWFPPLTQSIWFVIKTGISRVLESMWWVW